MRKVLFFLLFCLIMLSLPAFAKRLTQGFRIAKMSLDFPSRSEWEIMPEIDIQPILKQKYRYIGRGAQCYVFESEDEKYVIKLFRYDRCPSEKKVVALFNACKMAYDHLQKETGLIYIHLNPSQDLPVITCRDAVGRKYKIILDSLRFVVQKKGISFRKALELAQQNPNEMKDRIDQFLKLLSVRIAKEIKNTDPNLSRNFGFLEDRAIEFDFGNYRHCPGLDCTKERDRYALKLRRWLKKHAPEWVAYLDEQIQ